MKRAYCMIRSRPHYRCDAFMTGLKLSGFDVRTGPPQRVETGDIVVMWNRYAENHEIATRFERAGGTVIVAENGYVKGPHDGGGYYALALDAHNGRGRWPVGGPERWEALAIALKPWRTTGDHILVAANRSFGQPGSAMPIEWPAQVKKRLQAVTQREVRVRMHPGNQPARVPLEDDLRGAHAVVIWSSSVGVRALIEGIPVICCAPWWVCKPAAESDVTLIETPWRYVTAKTVRSTLERMAHAQYHVDELATGEPFARLIEHHYETQAVPA